MNSDLITEMLQQEMSLGNAKHVDVGCSRESPTKTVDPTDEER